MVFINGREFNLEKEISVERMLEIKRYTYPKIIVKINGVVIPKNKYSTTKIKDKDEIQVIHLLGGG